MLATSGGTKWRPFEVALFILLSVAAAFSVILLVLTIVYSDPYPHSYNHPLDITNESTGIRHRGGWSRENVQLRYAATCGGLASIFLSILAVERRAYYVCYAFLMFAFSIIHIGATSIDGRDIRAERNNPRLGADICNTAGFKCGAQPYIAICVFDALSFAIYLAIAIMMFIFRNGPPAKKGAVHNSVAPGQGAAAGAAAGAGTGCCGGSHPAGGHPHDKCCPGKKAKAPAAAAGKGAPAPAPAAAAKKESTGCCAKKPKSAAAPAAKAKAPAAKAGPPPATKAPAAPKDKAPARSMGSPANNEQAEARTRLLAMKPHLGIIAKDTQDPGVEITSVLPDKPGELAGLKKGDILLRLGKSPIDSHPQFLEVLKDVFPGETMEFDIVRDGKAFTQKVQFGGNDVTMAELAALRSKAGADWVKEQEESSRVY